MQEIDIVYMYEYAAKELDVACAIKHILQRKHGLKTEIIQWPCGYHRVYGKLRPKVAVLPSCYTSRSYVRCLLDWHDTVYFNMSWEQLFYKGNREAKSPHGKFPRKHVIHHAWGSFYADFLQKNGIPKEHIFINGQPAFTLYQEPYRRYFKDRRELAAIYGLDPSRKWVFLPENYNWAFFPESVLKMFVNDGQSPDEVSVLKEFCHSTLTKIIIWLDDLVRHDGIEVVIRPRPSVLPGDLKAFILKTIRKMPERMHLIEGESVRDWIMASDVVISTYSTSLIEAAVAGKAAYILEPHEIPPVLFVEWQRLIPHIKTSQELVEACLSPRMDGSRQLEEWAKSTVMAAGDPIENLAEYLAGLCRGDIPQPPYHPKKGVVEWLNWPLPSWLTYELLKIGLREGRQKPFKKIEPDYVKDFISQDEIERKVLMWGKLLDTRHTE